MESGGEGVRAGQRRLKIWCLEAYFALRSFPEGEKMFYAYAMAMEYSQTFKQGTTAFEDIANGDESSEDDEDEEDDEHETTLTEEEEEEIV